MKKKANPAVTAATAVVLVLCLLIFWRREFAEEETELQKTTLSAEEANWAEDYEQRLSEAEKKEEEKPTLEGKAGLVVNTDDLFHLNEMVKGYHGQVEWKVTKLELNDKMEDYPSEGRYHPDCSMFLDETGVLSETEADYVRLSQDQDGNTWRTPQTAYFRILIVEMEVRNGLDYEYDFEFPLRIGWFEEKEGLLCDSFATGSMEGEEKRVKGMFSQLTEGIPFYSSAGNGYGTENQKLMLFCKLKPGETRRFQVAFLVDINTLENTWLYTNKGYPDYYLYYGQTHKFLIVSECLDEGE